MSILSRRREDWPVMNVHTIGFSLVPFGFFDKNPAATTRTTPERPKVIVMDKPIPPDVTKCVPLPQEKRTAVVPKATKRGKVAG
jgi:primary-amine oxidase